MILADSWSLKGMTIRVVFSVVVLEDNKDWSATLNNNNNNKAFIYKGG